MYATCALYPLEERYKHKILIGFFPEHKFKEYLKTGNDTRVAQVKREYRNAFFNAMFSPNSTSPSVVERSFDWYNQMPFKFESAPKKLFLLSWLVIVSDYPHSIAN